MKLLLSLPFQLVAVIIGVILLGSFVPLPAVEFFYTVSVCFKELLSQVLPFMVFFFVLSGILSFRKSAPIVLAILVSLIFVSNGIVASLSYAVMKLIAPFISCSNPTDIIVSTVQEINPWFVLNLPLPINVIHALFSAVVLGLILSFISVRPIEQFVLSGKRLIQKILTYGFIPVLPLYVLGFLLKMRAEGLLSCLAQQYGSAFLLIIVLQCLYTLFIFFVATGFSLSRAWRAIKNAMPSYLTAFSTMSSVASVPAAIDGAEKNTKNRPLAEMTIPIMANMHMLGDSVGTPILSMFSMLIFQGTMPTFAQYVEFVPLFCTAMFAAAGVPGGGILVMIPLLVSLFNFTPDMVSVITMLYFLLDPFGTAANVMGDGALTIILHKVLKRLRISSDE